MYVWHVVIKRLTYLLTYLGYMLTTARNQSKILQLNRTCIAFSVPVTVELQIHLTVSSFLADTKINKQENRRTASEAKCRLFTHD